jgi:hypothetical protein
MKIYITIASFIIATIGYAQTSFNPCSYKGFTHTQIIEILGKPMSQYNDQTSSGKPRNISNFTHAQLGEIKVFFVDNVIRAISWKPKTKLSLTETQIKNKDFNTLPFDFKACIYDEAEWIFQDYMIVWRLKDASLESRMMLDDNKNIIEFGYKYVK